MSPWCCDWCTIHKWEGWLLGALCAEVEHYSKDTSSRSAFTHGLVGKCMELFYYNLCLILNFLISFIPWNWLKELKFIPAVTGKCVSDLERSLLALPVQMWGLKLCDPSAIASFLKFDSFLQVALSLIHSKDHWTVDSL